MLSRSQTLRLTYKKWVIQLAESQYKPVIWNQNDLAAPEKLAQGESNVDWVKDNTPRTRYRAFSVDRAQGIRILSGVAMIPAQTDSTGSVNVSFGSFFTPDCQPVITHGIVSEKRKLHVTITGLGQFIPDDRGFNIFAQMNNSDPKRNILDSRTYVPWTAVGY